VLLLLRKNAGQCSLGRVENALTGVPVQESLAPEHSGELRADPLEHLLDGPVLEAGVEARTGKALKKMSS